MPGLVPVGDILDSISITKLRLKQLDAIQLVRDQRANGKQELAYHARPFVLCGLPLRRPRHRLTSIPYTDNVSPVLPLSI